MANEDQLLAPEEVAAEETTTTPMKEVVTATTAAPQEDVSPRRYIVNRSGRIFRHQRRNSDHLEDEGYFDIMSDLPDCAAEGRTSRVGRPRRRGRPCIAASSSGLWVA